MLRVAPTPPAWTHPAAASPDTVQVDLCRLARAERGFYAATGHYAPENELRSSGDLTLPPDARWPYQYRITVPAADRFLVIASRVAPLNTAPPAILVDQDLQVCRLLSHPPRTPVSKLDDLGRLEHPERWGEQVRCEYGQCQ